MGTAGELRGTGRDRVGDSKGTLWDGRVQYVGQRGTDNLGDDMRSMDNRDGRKRAWMYRRQPRAAQDGTG